MTEVTVTSGQDPISELTEKFRESLVERGMKRYEQDSVIQRSDDRWEVAGLDRFDDEYTSYSVEYDPGQGKYICSCYGHQWGGSRSRSVCSHVMAVMIFRRMDTIQDRLGSDEPSQDALTDLIDRIWPHPEYRANQQEVIADALKTLYNDGKDYYCVSAPTGFGKSPVCYSLGNLIGIIEAYRRGDETVERTAERALEGDDDDLVPTENGYYITPQNILLDQLEDDYGDLPDFSMLKGRAHYSCSNSDDGETCADGPCRYNSDLTCDGYGAAKEAMFESPVANTNFTMFMIHPQISHRPGLVIDEAHMAPEYVLSKVSVELREDQLGEWDWEVPRFDNFPEYVDWMVPRARELALWVEEAKETLTRASNRGEWSKEEKQLAKKVDRTERLKRKLANLIRDYRKHEEPWVVEHEDFYDERRGEEIEKVTFRPVTPYRFMDDLVFSKAGKAVISSATPPQSELLGVDGSEVHVEEIPSEFPIENRPIHYEPVGKMSKANRDDNRQKAALKIKDVQDGNTLVHCHTYQFASDLARTLETIGVREDDMVVQRRGQGRSRESYLNEWLEGDETYFLSVNYYDGLDLPDDLCRTNVMCVVPFPYLGDPQVQRRKEVEGDRFFRWQTAMRVMQAYGRSTRSKEDWSDFYIIDSNFKWFYNANRDLFFEWFTEAVDDI